MRHRTHPPRPITLRGALSIRSLGLVAPVVAVVLALAACGGSSGPHVASLSASNTGARTTGASTTYTPAEGRGGSPQTKSAKRNPTALVDQWAACVRSHGDPNQADPMIDSHGVINITTPPLRQGGPLGLAHGGSGACSRYLVRAQIELRAEFAVPDPRGPSEATYLKYVNCMRANGIPNYPYPSGPDDRETNFNGTGVDPNSLRVERVNDVCGKMLGLPRWWINGWGPPGDISIAPPKGGPPLGLLVPTGNGVSGANSGLSAGG